MHTRSLFLPFTCLLPCPILPSVAGGRVIQSDIRPSTSPLPAQTDKLISTATLCSYGLFNNRDCKSLSAPSRIRLSIQHVAKHSTGKRRGRSVRPYSLLNRIDTNELPSSIGDDPGGLLKKEFQPSTVPEAKTHSSSGAELKDSARELYAHFHCC